MDKNDMVKVKFYDNVDDKLLKFAVIISKTEGKWVFCKHKERNTLEAPGGHRECGECIDDTAKRELYEETGAIEFDIKPACVYSVTAPDNFDGKETFGMLYFADIKSFEKELHSEIEKIVVLDDLPEEWTYPLIQPRLIEEYQRRTDIKGSYQEGNIELKKHITDSLLEKYRLLLFDLDGTLLQSDKTISNRTLSALKQCREKGILLGVSTSRSEQNSMIFLNELMPDILITSGGALVKNGVEYIYKAEFTKNETRDMINMAKTVCGEDCEITIDTIDSHYWNYKTDPKKLDKSWGDSIYTDFSDFSERALKMCVEIFDKDKADMLAENLSQCDCIRFSDGYWYKFTKKNVTKENAIMRITEVCGFGAESIIAFGDDFADIGMLEICGVGVAMGNAIDEVKNRANIVIGSNDEDGIAYFIEENILNA